MKGLNVVVFNPVSIVRTSFEVLTKCFPLAGLVKYCLNLNTEHGSQNELFWLV